MAPIRVATYAPEIDPDGTLLACFRRLGIRAQIGHTTCSYAQARMALAAGCGRLHPPLQRHVGPASQAARCGGRRPGACRIGRADPRLPACRRRRRARRPARHPEAPLHHRRRRRRRHARRRLPAGHPHHHQARRHGAPRRRQPRRQRADHGSCLAATSSPWACRSPRPPAAAARCRPTIWASPTAAGWCPVPPPTSSSWTRRAGSRRCWSRAGRSRVWLSSFHEPSRCLGCSCIFAMRSSHDARQVQGHN